MTMKNIKSMMIVCLAAVLILGFTACSQPTYTYKEVMGLEASVSKTVYAKGEVFDPNTISGTVYFSDGSSQDVSGTQLKYSLNGSYEDGILDSVATIQVTFTYGTAGNAAVSTDTIYVYDVASLALSNLPTTGTWNADKSEVTVDTDAVTGTATLTNGSVIELSAAEMAIEAGTVAPEENDGVATTATVALPSSVSVFGQSYSIGVDGITVTGAEEWEVKVPAASTEFDPENITGIVFEYTFESKNDSDVEYKNDGTDTAIYAGDGLTWTAYLVSETDSLEGRQEVSPADLIFGNAATKPAQSTSALKVSDAVEYTVYYRNDMSVTGEFSVPAVINWVKSVKVELNEDVTVDAGDSATLADLTITPQLFEKVAADKEEAAFTAVGWDEDTCATVINTAIADVNYYPLVQVKLGKGLADFTVIKTTGYVDMTTDNT